MTSGRGGKLIACQVAAGNIGFSASCAVCSRDVQATHGS